MIFNDGEDTAATTPVVEPADEKTSHEEVVPATEETAAPEATEEHVA